MPSTSEPPKKRPSRSNGSGGAYVTRREIPPGWMNRARLAKAAGVTRATVKHYNDLKLLPPPLMTGPNMAYYDPKCVTQIALVRSLQERRHLPLSVIAQMFEKEGAEGVQRAFHATEALETELMDLLPGGRDRPPTREELLTLPEIDESVLEDLEKLGLIRRKGQRGSYDPVSRKLVQAVSVMRERGLTEANGFRVKDLGLYVKKLRELLEAEIQLFQSRVVGRIDARKAEALTRAALPGADALVLAIRSRLLADLLEGLSFAPKGRK